MNEFRAPDENSAAMHLGRSRMRELQRQDLQYIWHPCSQMKDYEEMPPIVIERGDGIRLYDVDGKEYLDVVSSWWCNLLGHCHSRVSAAVERQLRKLEHVIFANFSHEPAIALCEKLASIVPEGIAKFHFSDNGSAAVECALKMSFQYHYQTGHRERKRFMALSGGYHGETIGALSVGGVDLYSEIYRPLLLDVIRVEAPDCYRCPRGLCRDDCGAPCFEAAERVFAEYGAETAAFIVEPLLQGAAGMRIYPTAYLRKLRAFCDHFGIHLIADEIATGFGRTGCLFACEHAGISPDLLCLSKGLTGGYLPMAITAATQDIYDAFYADYHEGKAFMHSHTYSGNPLACAAALEVLQILEDEDILARAAPVGDVLCDKLAEVLGGHPNVGEIRRIGLIHAIELVADRDTKHAFPAHLRLGYAIYRRALQKGLLLRPLGNVLYFNPPLTISRKDAELAVQKCAAAIREVLPG